MRPLKEITEETLMLADFNSPEKHRDRLKELINEFADDRVAMNILHNFYSFLPEAREDGILELRMITRKSGIFLLCAITFLDKYLFLVSMEKAELLGPLQQGLESREVLDFFGFPDNEVFRKKHPTIDHMELYHPVTMDTTLCPVCGVADGEFHIPGCPVEVCPWCAGQLTSCNCRFERSGSESLKRQKHLDDFLEILNKKGSVPYDAANHRPTWPGTS